MPNDPILSTDAPLIAVSGSSTPSASTRRFQSDFRAFTSVYPEYQATSVLDVLRVTEYSRLNAAGHVYADFTGGGLYAESQVRRHHELLLEAIYGNPHSTNPSSSRTSELVQRCRDRVLRFFNAPSDEYVVVFTANASAALKLVGEAYPFEPGDHYLLTFDNHNSVNGIREFARGKGARTSYVPLVIPDLRVDDADLERGLRDRDPGAHNLFAFPAQSNFSGVQHPLEWIRRAKALGWDVLLDAAALAPTNRLDLGRWHPDFVTLSFYKMFGYPTGIGALIARRESLRRLRRPWFAGGTISVASVQADRYFLSEGEPAFEDGTPDYLGIPAVEIGLDLMDTAGIDTIHSRVRCLTGWLLDQLLAMRHPTGRRLVRLYGPASTEGRGGTLTINLFDAEGMLIDHSRVEAEANRHNISLRTGCFCNPGAGEAALEIPGDAIARCMDDHEERFTLEEFRLCIQGPTGAVRISLGIASNFSDVHRLTDFVSGFLDRH